MQEFALPIKVDKDWGYELIIHNDEKYCGKILFIKKGHCISLQFHKKKTEKHDRNTHTPSDLQRSLFFQHKPLCVCVWGGGVHV